MTPRRYGQNCRFYKSPLSENSQKRLELKEKQTKYRKMTRKPRIHVRIVIYRTWAILLVKQSCHDKKLYILEKPRYRLFSTTLATKSLPSFKPRSTGYKSVYYGINKTRPGLRSSQVLCRSG